MEPFAVEWFKPNDRPVLLFLSAMSRILSVVRRCKPDVILVNDRSSLTVASVCRYAIPRAKIVPVVHGFRASHIRRHSSPNPLKYMLDRAMTRFYRSRDLVICVSAHMRSMYMESRFSCSTQRVVVVHNGIRDRFDRNVHSGKAIRRQWAISSSAKVLLTLARLTPIKGQDVIIKALPIVVTQHRDVVYIVAGNGDYQEQLSALALELGVSSHVIFTGAVDNDEGKYAYYDACDLFVMPSRFEPFGLSFLEAWHAAKPVLGGNRGGSTEIIEDGRDGVIVDPDDVPGVGATICELMANPARLQQMGRHGRLKAQQRFGTAAMVDNIVGALGH